jgi:hypothetical protein
MTWITKTKPHYCVIYMCGHVKEQCACTHSMANGVKITGVNSGLCPSCLDDLRAQMIERSAPLLAARRS